MELEKHNKEIEDNFRAWALGIYWFYIVATILSFITIGFLIASLKVNNEIIFPPIAPEVLTIYKRLKSSLIMIKSDYTAIEVGQKSLARAALEHYEFVSLVSENARSKVARWRKASDVKRREDLAKNIERGNLKLQRSKEWKGPFFYP